MQPKPPVKVWYARETGNPKTLTANTPEELESLLRIGWKLEEQDADR